MVLTRQPLKGPPISLSLSYVYIFIYMYIYIYIYIWVRVIIAFNKLKHKSDNKKEGTIFASSVFCGAVEVHALDLSGNALLPNFL